MDDDNLQVLNAARNGLFYGIKVRRAPQQLGACFRLVSPSAHLPNTAVPVADTCPACCSLHVVVRAGASGRPWAALLGPCRYARRQPRAIDGFLRSYVRAAE